MNAVPGDHAEKISFNFEKGAAVDANVNVSCSCTSRAASIRAP